MKTPNKIELTNYQQQLNAWRAKHDDPKHPDTCKVCGGKLTSVMVYVSIHDAHFSDCVGWGKVLDFDVPWCMGCELAPARTGCVHIPTCPIVDPFIPPTPKETTIIDFSASGIISLCKRIKSRLLPERN